MTTVDAHADEAMLAERAAAGNTEAFDVLVSRFRPRATALAHEWCSDPADVEDVVDQAFIKAYRSIGRFRAECTFSTWLHRIVVNTAIDSRIRCKWKGVEQPLSEELILHFEGTGRLSTSAFVQDQLEYSVREDRLDKVRHGMQELPPRSRDILTLCYVAHKPYAAIARILGIKLGTVRSRLNRARAELRAALHLN